MYNLVDQPRPRLHRSIPRQMHEKNTVQRRSRKELLPARQDLRFQNIISATKGDGFDNSDYNEGSVIWFHIFSISGRLVKDFIPQDNSQKDVVLFKQGQECLIVDRQDDQSTGITHVYIREIELGFGKNVVRESVRRDADWFVYDFKEMMEVL